MGKSPVEEPEDRPMNDSTMPLPKKSGSSKIVNAAPRRKTGRFGLAEWNRLLSVSTDLAQRKGQPLRRIPPEEVRQHNSMHDGWIILRGKVYNVSPYLAYHPGGQAILKPALGKDASSLYDKYHPWVNEENLIGKLLVGYLGSTLKQVAAPSSNDGFPVPAARVALATSLDSDEED